MSTNLTSFLLAWWCNSVSNFNNPLLKKRLIKKWTLKPGLTHLWDRVTVVKNKALSSVWKQCGFIIRYVRRHSNTSQSIKDSSISTRYKSSKSKSEEEVRCYSSDDLRNHITKPGCCQGQLYRCCRGGKTSAQHFFLKGDFTFFFFLNCKEKSVTPCVTPM